MTERLYKQANLLALITIGYNLLEGLVSIWFGLADETIALFGFGADSFVEVISGIGIWHMLRRQAAANQTNRDAFEQRALRITGSAFYLLTAGLIATAIIAPIAAAIIQMAISRSREYLADAGGAGITKNPYGLAGALEKLTLASQAVPMDAKPATAHMFIVNPLSGKALMNLFSTHPPLAERISRLRSMKPN